MHAVEGGAQRTLELRAGADRRLLGEALLDVVVKQLVGLCSGGLGRRKTSSMRSRRAATQAVTALAWWTLRLSRIRKILRFAPLIRRFRKRRKIAALSAPTMKRRRPRLVTLEIMLVVARRPGAAITGVEPLGAKLRPSAAWLETPLSSPQWNDRCVGICYLEGQDISEVMVRGGLARDCPRFSGGRFAVAERQTAADGATIRRAYTLPGYCRPRCNLRGRRRRSRR